jgi:hypothetical protein
MPIALLKAGVLVNGVLTPAGDTTNASTLTAAVSARQPPRARARSDLSRQNLGLPLLAIGSKSRQHVTLDYGALHAA